MNLAEATSILGAISCLNPAQKFDPGTPALWALALADVRYEDAKGAVLRLSRLQPWIGVHDISQEVAAIRAARVYGPGGDLRSPLAATVRQLMADALVHGRGVRDRVARALADGTLDHDSAAAWIANLSPAAVASINAAEGAAPVSRGEDATLTPAPVWLRQAAITPQDAPEGP